MRYLLTLCMLAAVSMPGLAASLPDLMSPDGIPDRFSGPAEASATLIIYSSPTCSHCIHFEESILPDLKRRFAASGRLRVVIRPMVRNAVDMAIFLVAHASGPFRSDATLARYRAHYAEIVAARDIETVLRRIAAEAGFDGKTFDLALHDKAYARKLTQMTEQATRRFQVNGTPAFFLNGRALRYDGTTETLAREIQSVVVPSRQATDASVQHTP